jgi:Dolichyl-phosphate-mannose-protein mannosyltransferase
MGKFAKWAIILLLILLLVSLLASSAIGYNQFIQILAGQFTTNKNSIKLEKILTLNRYRSVQLFMLSISGILLFSLFRLDQISAFINRLIHESADGIKSCYNAITKTDLKYILILPFVASIYFAITLPVSFDEALTYLVFTSRGPLVSLSYYPYPNNHVLHSLITNFTRFIPLTELFNLRISSILINVFTWTIAYKFIAVFYNKKTALIITGISAVLFLNIYYSYMSRGYSLLNLFFMICLYCSFKISNHQTGKKYWVWFTLSSILGFFTMPSFLYPYVTLNLYILIKRRDSFKKQVLMGISTVAAVIFLYTPIIIVNGLKALTGNDYVKPISRSEVIENLRPFLLQSIREISGFHWAYILPALLISFLFCLIYQRKEDLLNFLFFILIVPAILILHSVIPFPRTFMYYGFLLVFLTVNPFRSFIDKIKINYLLPLVLLVQLLLISNFNQSIVPYEERDPQINFTSAGIVSKIKGNKKYLCSGALIGTNLWFELKTNNFDSSKVDFIEAPISADTVAQYNYIIIARYYDRTATKKPLYSNFYYSVYSNE